MDNNLDNQNVDQPENNAGSGVPPTPPSADAPSTTPVQDTSESSPMSSSESVPSSSSEDTSTVVTTSGSGEGKKPLGIMIGALLVLIVIFMGLLFFFVFNKPSEPEQPTQQVPVEDLQPSPTAAATPTPELTEEVIDGIDIGSPEAELSPIQEDLEEL